MFVRLPALCDIGPVQAVRNQHPKQQRTRNNPRSARQQVNEDDNTVKTPTWKLVFQSENG